MRITKYEHACLVVVKNQTKVIVDPGGFSSSLPDEVGVAAVMVTHEHADHWTPERLDRIVAANPGVRIFGPAGVVAVAETFEVTEVKAGDAVAVGDVLLEFFGGSHAQVHPRIPIVDNVGVLFDHDLYYPGDSLVAPSHPVNTLAVPAAGPWLKIGEAMALVETVRPEHTILVHDAHLAPVGRKLVETLISSSTAEAGGTFLEADVGESVEV